MIFQPDHSYRYKYPNPKQGETYFNSNGDMDWLLTEEFTVVNATHFKINGRTYASVALIRNNGRIITTATWHLCPDDFEESITEKINLILN